MRSEIELLFVKELRHVMGHSLTTLLLKMWNGIQIFYLIRVGARYEVKNFQNFVNVGRLRMLS